MELSKFNFINPQMQYFPEYDMKPDTPWYGVKALFYDGADYKGKKTKVFAHIGYPDVEKGQKVPAVVLVHGGGGHAFPEWIKYWNKRGFAAIAMDTTGFVPKEENIGLLGTETTTMDVDYVYGLYKELMDDDYVSGPDNSRMLDYDLPIEDQWMYHAVADTILAHNILLNDERIDSSKIGIVGISWGAVITAIAIGYDTRYAFAIPIYGSGFLDFDFSPKLPTIFQNPKVKELWSAADRFDKVTCPVLWKCWLYDKAFSTGANSLSYLATKNSGSFFSVSHNIGHGHVAAWRSEDSYRFARCVIEDKLPLIKVVTSPEGCGKFSFTIEIPEDFVNVEAEIFYSTVPMEYDEDSNPKAIWKAIKAEIEDNKVVGNIPDETCCYFVELRGKMGDITYISDTEVVFNL